MLPSKCPFLPLVLNKSNNNRLAEYHGIFIPFQGQVYSKQGSHISLLFGTWMKPKNFYCWHWPDKLCWRSTFSSKYQMNYVFPTGFTYTLFTKTSLFLRISLLKCLIYKRVNNLRFSLVQQFLSQISKIRSRQYILILSGKSFLPLKLSIACSQEKYSQQKNLAYLTDSEYLICLLKKRSRL